MAKMHLCLVCHCCIEKERHLLGVRCILEALDNVEQQTGKRVNVTWAHNTAWSDEGHEIAIPTFVQLPDTYLDLVENRGDEVGLHIHCESQQKDDWRRQTVDRYIEGDTRRLIDAGFPAPKTFISYIFIFFPSTLRILERMGYEVDSSVTRANCAPYRANPVWYCAPSRRLHECKPYRLSRSHVTEPGDSTVIEVPYSGHMLELVTAKDREILPTGDKYTSHIADRFRTRWEKRQEEPVDIFEIFFHFGDFIKGSLEVDGPRQERLVRFLTGVAAWGDVTFPALHKAVSHWKAEAEPTMAHGGDA